MYMFIFIKIICRKYYTTKKLAGPAGTYHYCREDPLYVSLHHHDHKLKYMNTWLIARYIHVHVGIDYQYTSIRFCTHNYKIVA